jgi:hypothetical protein
MENGKRLDRHFYYKATWEICKRCFPFQNWDKARRERRKGSGIIVIMDFPMNRWAEQVK